MKKFSEEELIQFLADCERDLGFFAKAFFPERFYRPFSDKIHKPILELLNSDEKKVVIAAPRGIGKTSLINLALPAYNILFRKRRHIINISDSLGSALEQTENLRNELVSNEFVRQIFGSCESPSWAKDQWDTKWLDSNFSTRVRPRGAGQAVRGRLYRNHRPDLIIIDDLEDPDNMDNSDQRKKKKEWFFADVLNSIDRFSDDWRVIFIGTVLHEDSLLINLLEDPNWKSVRLEICDDNFESNWPEVFSNEDIKQLYQGLRKQGLADVFAREYRNLPISRTDAVFNAKFFKYHKEKDLIERFNSSQQFLANAVIVDPAKTAQLNSADSAIVGVSIDFQTEMIYQRDIINGKFHPDELYHHAIDMAIRLKAQVLAVEVTGLNEFITYPFKTAMMQRRLSIEFIELKARRGATRGDGKEDRIAALASFYRRGMISHNEDNCDVLENQLIAFPRSRLWDVMDCFAYVIELLDIGERYFDKAFQEIEDDIEKEYEDLQNDNEPAFEYERILE